MDAYAPIMLATPHELPVLDSSFVGGRVRFLEDVTGDIDDSSGDPYPACIGAYVYGCIDASMLM